jgi:hypothetical protein
MGLGLRLSALRQKGQTNVMISSCLHEAAASAQAPKSGWSNMRTSRSRYCRAWSLAEQGAEHWHVAIVFVSRHSSARPRSFARSFCFPPPSTPIELSNLSRADRDSAHHQSQSACRLPLTCARHQCAHCSLSSDAPPIALSCSLPISCHPFFPLASLPCGFTCTWHTF